MGVTATPLIMAWQGYSGLPERREVTDEAEAEAVLDYLDGGHHGPVLVEVFDTSGHGPLLTVAAGGQRSAAAYQETLDPPYYISAGGGAPAGESFSYGGQESEFPPDSLIDKRVVRTILREFMATRTRPTAVTWQET